VSWNNTRRADLVGSQILRIPLPKEVPMSFRVLPEYIIEDIVEYLLFAVQ
jgi:ubiquitin conjugation factor E4 B